MAVVSAVSTLRSYDTAVRLARYAQRMGEQAGFTECQFWGVRDDDTIINAQCREIWTKAQRDQIGFYLGEAQRAIEDEVGYPLQPTWVTGTATGVADDGSWRYVDERPYRDFLVSRWARIIEPGVRAEETVAAGELVSYATEPATIGPVATTVTDVSEIIIRHAGTEIEIDPSQITISGGDVTVNIPRCRLVKPSLANNDQHGLDYADLSNFVEEIDIIRVYNDPATQGVMLYDDPTCLGTAGCTQEEQTACIRVDDPRLGFVSVLPGSYGGGSWTLTGCRYRINRVRLNYRAGLLELPEVFEDAIIRLAHSKMPRPPCGCERLASLWGDEHKVPEVLTRERLNCPFGVSDGAWWAWSVANSNRVTRLGVM